ncbi:MAG: MATE family efflux transporter [Anaerolineaceae bacterium]|nr:MATE family efflux transporter [Anaerolineaceae bacterium]
MTEANTTVHKMKYITEDPVGKTLLRLGLPMLAGIGFFAIFSLVEGWAVGKVGVTELAAIGYTYSVLLVFNAITRGLGVGVTAVISKAVGKGDHHEVQRLATDGLLLGLLVMAVIVLVGQFTIDPLFRLLGADDAVMPHIRAYMRIMYFSCIPVVFPMVGSSSIRAIGNTKVSALLMSTDLFTNMILAPILIIGWGPVPALGIRGAAFASLIARGVALLATTYFMVYREKLLTFERISLAELKASWKRILSIGIPSAISNMLLPIAMTSLTSMVGAFGHAAVAAFGVGMRLENFIMIPIRSTDTVLPVFIGQNWGAGKEQRVKDGYRLAFIFSLAWGLFIYLLVLLFAEPIAAIFNTDPAVILSVKQFLQIVPLSYGIFGLFLLSSNALNALTYSIPATILAVLRLFVLTIPLAYLGSRYFGFTGVLAGFALANLISGISSWTWLRRCVVKAFHPASDPVLLGEPSSGS